MTHKIELRCIFNLIGVHLRQIELIGHDLERHTPVPHSVVCVRAQTKLVLSHIFEEVDQVLALPFRTEKVSQTLRNKSLYSDVTKGELPRVEETRHNTFPG